MSAKKFNCEENNNKKNISKMIKGYKEMATINVELANKSLSADNEAFDNYELFLAECEDCDCEKRRHLLR